MLNQLGSMNQETKIEYGLMVMAATLAIGAGFAPIDREASVLFAAVFLGISAGLWLSHLLTMLHTAVEQNNLSTDG
jgi:hypothetical protein